VGGAAEGGRRSSARRAVGKRGDARVVGARRATRGSREEDEGCGRRNRRVGSPYSARRRRGGRGYLGASLEVSFFDFSPYFSSWGGIGSLLELR
jgi:hypothetical protein